jgi:hypothetical protein
LGKQPVVWFRWFGNPLSATFGRSIVVATSVVVSIE